MCGRYESWTEDDKMESLLEMEQQGSAERYLKQAEVFPGTVQPVLYGSRVRVRAHLSGWGLFLPLVRRGPGGRTQNGARGPGQIRMGEPDQADGELTAPDPAPSARGGGKKTFINVRSETAAEKPRFAPVFRENGDGGENRIRRVIVPVSAYYEWSGGVRYRIADGDGDLLFLGGIEEDDGELLRENAPDPAGVYACFSSAAMPLPRREEFRGRTGASADAFAGENAGSGKRPCIDPGRRHAILTAAAEGEVTRIHSRMPLFLRREECEDWLYDAEFARSRLRGARRRTLDIRASGS